MNIKGKKINLLENDICENFDSSKYLDSFNHLINSDINQIYKIEIKSQMPLKELTCSCNCSSLMTESEQNYLREQFNKMTIKQQNDYLNKYLKNDKQIFAIKTSDNHFVKICLDAFKFIYNLKDDVKSLPPVQTKLLKKLKINKKRLKKCGKNDKDEKKTFKRKKRRKIKKKYLDESTSNENSETDSNLKIPVNKKLKFIKPEGKIQGPPCNCPNLCYNLISPENRKQIFDNFWKLDTADKQTTFLLDCIKSKQHQKKLTNFLQNLSFSFHVNNNAIEICRNAFLNLLGLKRYYLERLANFLFDNDSYSDNKNSIVDITEAIEFIRHSVDFRNSKKNNVSGCYKKYLNDSSICNHISEHKFRQLFKEQLDLKPTRMCRICLNMCEQNELFDLYSQKDNHTQISSSIMQIVPIQLDKNESNLPQLICKKCLEKLDIALDFRQLCLESDEILKNGPKSIKKENNLTYEIEIKTEFDDANGEQLGFNLDEHSEEINKYFSLNNFKFSEDSKPEENDLKWNCDEDDEEQQIATKDHLGIDDIKIYRQYQHQKFRKVNKAGAIALGPPCTCPKKCYYLIGKENIRYIYHKFWNLKRLNVQSSYIHSCLLSKPVERRTVKDAKGFSTKRGQTIIYRIKKNGEYIRICRQAFLNMHGYKENRLKTILTYLKEKTIQNEPDRTKIKKKYTKKTEEMKKVLEKIKEEMIQSEDVENIVEDEKPMEEDQIPEDMLPTYKCEVCDKVFVNKRTFRWHKVNKDHLTDDERRKRARAQRHKPNENGEWVCADCGAIFMARNQYRNHVSYHHTLKHTCEKCGQVFDNIKKFRNHMYRHTGIRHLSCNVCGRTYFSVDVLGKHKRTHLIDQQRQQKLFPCSICGKSFIQQNYLQQHINLKHNRLVQNVATQSLNNTPLSFVLQPDNFILSNINDIERNKMMTTYSTSSISS